MCFLVLSVLLIPDLVVLKLLFLVLSLCLYGENVARGGFSGSLQSEVEMSDKTEKLFVSSMVEFEKSELAKLGMPHWQQIHENGLFWRSLYVTRHAKIRRFSLELITIYEPKHFGTD